MQLIPSLPRLFRTFGRLMYRRTVPSLIVLLLAGTIAAVVNLMMLSSQLIESQALQSSFLYANALQQARTFYSENVVKKLKKNPAVKIDHFHLDDPNTIPIPATFMIDMGKKISAQDIGVSFRLFSNYPFKTRHDGGPRDSFEREAIAFLSKNPDKTFWEITDYRGRRSFRYATADRMKASCVACHNSHPASIKRDWKVGDVRGVLEVTTPIDMLARKARSGVLVTLLTTGGLLTLAGLGVLVVVKRLKHISGELERKIKQRTSTLRETNIKLREEQQKSTDLLLNILPGSIVQRIQDGEKDISEMHSDASILFADIVNFTKLSEEMGPQRTVEVLDKIFTRFDQLTEFYGLEKIKTIGDSYMVASGLPSPREDHAEAIADLALDMRDALQFIDRQIDLEVDIRIGINSGSVVAGVIGEKKFIYDLWGDTVNIAARMESHALPGSIQVSQATYELLRGKYRFEGRGSIPIKGKGEMTAYLLKSKRHQAKAAPAEAIPAV